DKVRLQAVLAFISDLLKNFGYSDKGFSIQVLPTGLRSLLDLPVPDIQGGTFGIANLHLGFVFELQAVPFKLITHLSVGSKQTPFTLTVFILGGAGWVDFHANYTPASGEL